MIPTIGLSQNRSIGDIPVLRFYNITRNSYGREN